MPTLDWVSLYSNNLALVNLLPSNISTPLCADWWFYISRDYTQGYGIYKGTHCKFDLIRSAANKKLVANHATNTDDILWPNKNDVRSLTDQIHKLKLGGPNGPGVG